jgi:hypothetical protein
MNILRFDTQLRDVPGPRVAYAKTLLTPEAA